MKIQESHLESPFTSIIPEAGGVRSNDMAKPSLQGHPQGH